MGSYSDIISIVTRRAQTTRDEADTVTKATVAVLAELAKPTEWENLVGQLPRELHPQEPTGRTGIDSPKDFLARAATLGRLEQVRTSRLVCAALAAMDATAASSPLRAILEHIGPEYDELLPPPAGLRDAAGFAAVVARRAELESDDRAQAAIGATLATLAERVSSGQVGDLEPYLPPELRLYLQRPDDDGGAEAFGRATFVQRVARAEDTDTETATRHARAVLLTLHETVPEREIQDTVAQLPDDVAALLR